MAWFIGQSILIIAAAFLLGILVGWLTWGRTRRPRPAMESAAEAPGSAVMVAGAGHTAAGVAAAAETKTAEPVVAAERVGEAEAASTGGAETVDEVETAGAERVEAERVEAERVEAERVEAERVEAERVEAERVEAERVEAERVEAERVEAERVEAEPVEAGVARAEPAGGGAKAVAAQAVGVAVAVEPGVPDDLERIEGIGPKMAGALLEAGIRTYAQLASADEATLRRAIEAHGMRFAPSIVTWGRQARLLADGDEEGFADLTRRLVAGRDEGRE